MHESSFLFMKSAQFFKKGSKYISKKIIDDLFKKLSSKRKGNYVFKKLKETSELGCTYSLMSFKYVEEPTFLSNTPELELKYAFILVAEYSEYVVVLKKNIAESQILKTMLGIIEIPMDYFLHFKAQNTPSYRGITSLNMNMARNGIRSRSYNSYGNLQNHLSPIFTTKAILSQFKIEEEKIWSITPNTSRINEQGAAVKLEVIIQWIVNICGQFSISNLSPFILLFAKRVELDFILNEEGQNVVAFFIDLTELINLINSKEATVTFNGKELILDEYDKLFAFFEKIRRVKNNCYGKFGKIKINKKTITISSEYLNNLAVHIQGTQRSLTRYINESKILQCMFDTPKYTYYAGNCYMDDNITNIIPMLSSILNDKIDFSMVKSEKESNLITSSSTNFSDSSLFRQIEKNFSRKNAISICDDLGDEWADHIVIREDSIYYIHEKFKEGTSLGASSFHEVVSQAIKNLRYINATTNDYLQKYITSSWGGFYGSSKIKRFTVVGRSFSTEDEERKYLEKVLTKLNSNPNAIKKIILATPFLSKKDLLNELQQVKDGKPTKAYVYQLLWLLSSFIGSCQENSAQVEILCSL